MKEYIKFGFISYVPNLNFIDDIFESVGKIYSIPENKLYDIILGTREAAVNSIKHGYKACSGMVDIILEISFNDRRFMEITIVDHGTGFNPERIPDPLDKKNLLKPSGRGILLIKHLSDHCSIESSPASGTKVNFRKYL